MKVCRIQNKPGLYSLNSMSKIISRIGLTGVLGLFLLESISVHGNTTTYNVDIGKLQISNISRDHELKYTTGATSNYEGILEQYMNSNSSLNLKYAKVTTKNTKIVPEVGAIKKPPSKNKVAVKPSVKKTAVKKSHKSTVKPAVKKVDKKDYSYALKPSKYNTRYLSKGELDLLITYSKKYKVDPHLVIGVIWIESRFDPKAKSKKSSSSGYGQFIKSTGKWVYKDILKLPGKYDHRIHPMQPKNSIPMVCAYVGYLLKLTKGDVHKTLLYYNGGEIGVKYHKIIDNYLKKSKSGVTLAEITKETKKNYK
ncbi:MAG: transglycosylase SLT domain-containing protein [Fusobacteriaceae bacterium]